MLGYTNIDSEKGFMFFQNFMKNNGILEELEELGIEDGDTVKFTVTSLITINNIV